MCVWGLVTHTHTHTHTHAHAHLYGLLGECDERNSKHEIPSFPAFPVTATLSYKAFIATALSLIPVFPPTSPGSRKLSSSEAEGGLYVVHKHTL